MKVYVTKKLLTDGVFSVDAEKTGIEFMLRYYNDNGSYSYLHKGDYALTKIQALEKFNEVRKRKIESLEKSLKKIKNMQFKVD